MSSNKSGKMARKMQGSRRGAKIRLTDATTTFSCSRLASMILSVFLCTTTTLMLVQAAAQTSANAAVRVDTTSPTGSNSNNLKVGSFHVSAPTSSPFVSAAAAAALRGVGLGAAVGPKTTRGPDVTVIRVTTDNHAAKSAKSQVVGQPAKTSVASTAASATSTAGLHKHSNKIIHFSDKLHKFDLYIDPVCEQIHKLTDKQLSKVFKQLRGFSQITLGGALAKCFKDNNFHVDLWTPPPEPQQQQQMRLGRNDLANFCSARNLASEPYEHFGDCAAKSWLAPIDAEIDRILKDRLHGNQAASGKAGLTSTEMSLIDDIVAHLHEEQVQEIASELAQEQKNLASANGQPENPTTTAATTTTTATATTTTTSRVLPLAGLDANSKTHQSIGKLIISSQPTGGGGGAAGGPSVAFDSKSSRDERDNSSARFAVQVQRANSLQNGPGLALSTPRPLTQQQLPSAKLNVIPSSLNNNKQAISISISNNNNNISNNNNSNLNTLIGRDNIKITFATTHKPLLLSQTLTPTIPSSKINIQVQGHASNNLLVQDKLKSSPITVRLANDIRKPASTQRPPVAPSAIILVTDSKGSGVGPNARLAPIVTTTAKPTTTTKSPATKALEIIKDAGAHLATSSLQGQAAAVSATNNFDKAPPLPGPLASNAWPVALAKPTPLPMSPAVIAPPPTATSTTTTTSVQSQSQQLTIGNSFNAPPIAASPSVLAAAISPGGLKSVTTIAPSISPLANILLNSVHLSTKSPLATSAPPLRPVTDAPFANNFGASAAVDAGLAPASAATLGAGTGAAHGLAVTATSAIQATNLSGSNSFSGTLANSETAVKPIGAQGLANGAPKSGAGVAAATSSAAPNSVNAALNGALSAPAATQTKSDHTVVSSSSSSTSSSSSSSTSSTNIQQVTTNSASGALQAPGLASASTPPTLPQAPPLLGAGAVAGNPGLNNGTLAADVATTRTGAINATAISAHLSAQGSALQPVVAKVASQAVAEPAKIEPAVLKNVDKALDLINGVTTTTSRPLMTTVPPQQAAILQALGSAFLEHTLAEKEKADVAVAQTRSPTTPTMPTTTPRTPSTTTARPSTRAPISANASVVVVSATDKADKKVDVVAESEKKEAPEHELLGLKDTSDASVEVHDVIVIGEHVDGDDLVHDHDDHHEKIAVVNVKGASAKDELHAHHDVKEANLMIHHEDHGEAKSSSSTGSGSSGLKKVETVTNEEDEGHADHAHLLKGLKAGDVIHVETGELDVKSGSE